VVTKQLPPESPHYKKLVELFNETKNATHMNKNSEVTGIEYVLSRHLLLQFISKLESMKLKNSNTKLVIGFHGTHGEDTKRVIARSNFAPNKIGSNTGNKGWFGKGFYFSEQVSTALGYNAGGQLLACVLAVGRTFQCPLPDSDLNPYHGKPCKTGYDSHYSPTKKELVMFNPKQILPCFLLNLNNAEYSAVRR
jgi:aprataxin and PNK-like factor